MNFEISNLLFAAQRTLSVARGEAERSAERAAAMRRRPGVNPTLREVPGTECALGTRVNLRVGQNEVITAAHALEINDQQGLATFPEGKVGEGLGELRMRKVFRHITVVGIVLREDSAREPGLPG